MCNVQIIDYFYRYFYRLNYINRFQFNISWRVNNPVVELILDSGQSVGTWLGHQMVAGLAPAESTVWSLDWLLGTAEVPLSIKPPNCSMGMATCLLATACLGPACACIYFWPVYVNGVKNIVDTLSIKSHRILRDYVRSTLSYFANNYKIHLNSLSQSESVPFNNWILPLTHADLMFTETSTKFEFSFALYRNLNTKIMKILDSNSMASWKWLACYKNVSAIRVSALSSERGM